jgi:beta-carotene 3-hydroxylase
VRPVLLALAAFVAMEPLTAATHRFVMHGVGMGLHRSHHRRRHHRWEANDAFPMMFAALVCAGLWLGFHDPAWSALVPLGVGVTAYGAAYAAVHDVYIHQRAGGRRGLRLAALDRLAAAHALHHRYGGPPYGMLLPIVPARLRDQASGSPPSQVPELA